MVCVTYSLPKVESPSLLWVWDDGKDPTFYTDGPDDDRKEACKHDAELEGKIGTKENKNKI